MSAAGDLITGEAFDTNGKIDSDDIPSRDDVNGIFDSFDDDATRPPAVRTAAVGGETSLEPGVAGHTEDRRRIDGAAATLRKPF